MEPISDDELFRKYRKGNRSAFDTLYERFRQPLYNYVRRSVRANRVDEIYQDIWLKVVASSRTYKENGKFRQWVFTCAHNLIVDEYRRNAKADYVTLPELESQDKISDTAVEREILVALEELPMEQRQAFHLRHELGCSVADIAQIQDCPVESAKSRLRYAYSKLRTQLKDLRP